jgi:hypothetical protein
VDGFERVYRVLPASEQSRDGDPLPFDLSRSASSAQVLMNVRVRKRAREERQKRMKSEDTRASVTFPRVGEVLTLKYSRDMQTMWGQEAKAAASVSLRVTRMVPRNSAASTAMVFAVQMNRYAD